MIINIHNTDTTNMTLEGSPEECSQFLQHYIGTWIDLAEIPSVLGEDLIERIQKYMKLREQGIRLVEVKNKYHDSIL